MTVATFDAGAQRITRGWAMIATIEGLGTFSGLYRWCSAVPNYASGNALYLQTMAEWPSPVSERAPRHGGMPEAGGLDVEIVDNSLIISAALRPDRRAQGSLASAVTASATSMTLASGTGFDASDGLIYIGGEAITYTTRAGAGLSGCTRGALGTTARAHAALELVYLSSPYLSGRRLSLYMAPLDGVDATTEQLLGDYRVATCDLSADNLSAWAIGGPSQLRFLARKIAVHRPASLMIDSVGDLGNTIRVKESQALGIGTGIAPLRSWSASDLRVWLVTDGDDAGEVMRANLPSTSSSGGTTLVVERRAELNTEVSELKRGSVLRQIITSDPTYGDIRRSPGPDPSESRASGTWNRTAQWVDVLLAVMTSSAHPEDGLELVNHRGVGGLYNDASLSDITRSNWSSLPVGYGIGIPANMLDLASFVAVRARTIGIDFPAVIIGREPEKFADFAGQFLGVMGAFFATTNGVISLVLPRLPLTGETLTTWDDDSILAVESVAYDLGSQSSITYKLSGPNGSDQTITLRGTDAALVASRGLLETDESDVSVETPGLRTDSAGINTLLTSMGAQQLFLSGRPTWRISLLMDAAQWNFSPGSLVAVTHSDLPNLSTGARGWTSVICQVLNKRGPYIHQRHGSVVQYELIAYAPNQQSHRVAQSAIVASSVVSGSNRVVTVAVNRYTSPDASALSLAVTDEGQFTAGQMVQEYSRAGVASGAARTVIGTAAGTVTISGTGAPTVGNVLATAAYADQIAGQRSYYASMGAIASMTLDGTAAAPKYAGR